MSNSFKKCPSTNNPSVHQPPRRTPIKKLKAKRKILRIQTFYHSDNIPRSAVVFPNRVQKIFLGVGNLEWVLWPMKKEKNSRSLFLNFAGEYLRSNEMEDKTFWVPFLRLPLTAIKFLADLRIDLTDCKSITEKTLWLIFSRLKHIQSLEYLEVCLKRNQNLTHSGIQYIASFAKNLRSLKGFYFGRSEASSTKAQGLNMTTLMGINIANHIYKGFKLDDKSLILLSPAIRVMKSVTNLTLNLLDTKTTDAGLIPLFKALTQLDQLQFFTLILCTSNIGDLGLIQLAQVLPNLRSLQGLVIDFGMCHQISEPGITSLMSSIQKLEELTDLFLSFYCCHRVNDKVVSLIATALELKELNYLVLDLGGCNINNAQSLLEEATWHIPDKQVRTGRVW